MVRVRLGHLALAIVIAAAWLVPIGMMVVPVARAAAVGWPTSTLVVSEVQTGGASASDEFVEVANQGAGAADLAGLEVVYATSSGSTVTRKATWSASTVLDPGSASCSRTPRGVRGARRRHVCRRLRRDRRRHRAAGGRRCRRSTRSAGATRRTSSSRARRRLRRPPDRASSDGRAVGSGTGGTRTTTRWTGSCRRRRRRRTRGAAGPGRRHRHARPRRRPRCPSADAAPRARRPQPRPPTPTRRPPRRPVHPVPTPTAGTAPSRLRHADADADAHPGTDRLWTSPRTSAAHRDGGHGPGDRHRGSRPARNARARRGRGRDRRHRGAAAVRRRSAGAGHAPPSHGGLAAPYGQLELRPAADGVIDAGWGCAP